MQSLVEAVRESCPVLQVALDLTSLEDALRVAYQVAEKLGSRMFVLEAGTPLIKSVGLSVVRTLRIFGKPVLADTKTADVGALEARLAASVGASAFSVLAIAPEETIRSAVEEARRLGIDVVADMLGVDPADVERVAYRLDRLGVSVLELHVPIDVQRRYGVKADILVEMIAKVKRVFRGLVAVAGGLGKGSVGLVARHGADIIVVGGAITRSSEPGSVALELVREIEEAAGS